jgi:ABC transport system ATP-binding/permease protein
MSEEILIALMELFAILVKQDKDIGQHHISYISNFLLQQLSEEQVNYYFRIFEEKAGLIPSQKDPESEEPDIKKPSSVDDSVMLLGICKQLNRTLVQEQKIIVLLRLYELVNTDHNFTKAKMNVLNTVAIVFKLMPDEINSIRDFIVKEDLSKIKDENILIINDTEENPTQKAKHLYSEGIDKPMIVLWIPSVDLYFIKYLGNDNIFLNGLPMNNYNIYLLAKGSSIKMVKSKPVFYSDIAARFMEEKHTTRFSFVARDIQYHFPNGDIGIQDVSFSENQGRLIGIMGASGAGKTTLLNVLCGLEKPTRGQVLINNIVLHEKKEQVQSIIGYVPQDDLLIEELTVFENLFFNVKFCFKNKSDKELTEKVNKTLSSLGLMETRNLRVGSPLNKMISGGQRKRLNIALELIREPSIFFVDEPTSGLSSRDSENVMDLLHELTLKGKLVIAVIHQPSSDVYKMFDKMIILDNGGYLIYYGNPVEALTYFKRIDNQINSEAGECPTCGNVNPEQIFNIIEAKTVDEYGNYTTNRKVPSSKWGEFFKIYIKPEKIETITSRPPKILNIPGWFEQVKIYLHRDFLSKISDKQYVMLNLLEAPILGFILSYIIRYIVDPNSKIYIFRENENIPIYIFMSLIVALFLGLTVSAEEIFRDRKILKREEFLNLSWSGYLCSKIVILFMISAIQSILFIIIANTILEIKGMYFTYGFALFTTAAFANMLGLNISASFRSAVTIYIVIPLLIIPMMVLSGAMFSFDKLNRSICSVGQTPLIADIMPTKWSYEALMVHQFKNNKYQKIFYNLEKSESISDFKNVYYIPELERHLENCTDEYTHKNKIDKTTADLQLLKNELSVQVQTIPGIAFLDADKLTKESFNQDVRHNTDNYLKKLKNYYTYLFMLASNKKEDTIAYLTKNGSGIFNKLKNCYYNESVSDIVTKVYEKNKILEYNGYLVQNTDPIYLDPSLSSNPVNFRAHFMSPTKQFFGFFIDTYWFNMIFIWVYTCLLYITLYFEAMRLTINLFEKIKQKKKL